MFLMMYKKKKKSLKYKLIPGISQMKMNVMNKDTNEQNIVSAIPIGFYNENDNFFQWIPSIYETIIKFFIDSTDVYDLFYNSNEILDEIFQNNSVFLEYKYYNIIQYHIS